LELTTRLVIGVGFSDCYGLELTGLFCFDCLKYYIFRLIGERVPGWLWLWLLGCAILRE
jgi:hypothetical protein